MGNVKGILSTKSHSLPIAYKGETMNKYLYSDDKEEDILKNPNKFHGINYFIIGS